MPPYAARRRDSVHLEWGVHRQGLRLLRTVPAAARGCTGRQVTFEKANVRRQLRSGTFTNECLSTLLSNNRFFCTADPAMLPNPHARPAAPPRALESPHCAARGARQGRAVSQV